MVSRAVTQLYDDVLRPSGLRVTQFSILATIARSGEANLRQLEEALAIDQTTLTRSLNLLERDRMIERVPHPDGRVKAMRLTRKGRRVLNVARPLWAQAQDKVLRDLGTRAWDDAQRRLARLLHVAVEKRRLRPLDTAIQKVRAAEDGWNSRDPERVARAYSLQSRWRNWAEFIAGREQIVAILRRKWNRELDYRLIRSCERSMAIASPFDSRTSGMTTPATGFAPS